MTSPSPAYVKRALDRLVEKARENASTAISRIHAANTAKGLLESGLTLIQSNEAMLALMTTSINEGISLVFNVFENVTAEGIELLKQFSAALENVFAAPVWEWANVSGDPTANIKLKMAKELDVRLVEISAAAIDDFEHGMMGAARLKKEHVVSIVNNMINSPGGVQQAGVGEFSQTAFTDQSNNLIRAIDGLLASAEFHNLDEDKREAVADVANALKQEAATKDHPDPGRLKRWGLRLSALTKEFGLHVAAAGVWHALGLIFSGSVAF